MKLLPSDLPKTELQSENVNPEVWHGKKRSQGTAYTEAKGYTLTWVDWKREMNV